MGALNHKAVERTLGEDAPSEADLLRMIGISREMAAAMRVFVGALDRSVHDELIYIADYLARARAEVAALQPGVMSAERIPAAGAELEAALKQSEEATHKIMNAVEAILSADATSPDSYRTRVRDQALTILETCAFQDIVGQRLSKVVLALSHIEERVSRFAAVMGVPDQLANGPDAAAMRDARNRELMLHGPALKAVSQDEIDALFN
jgi:chemotaxis protein CheZ